MTSLVEMRAGHKTDVNRNSNAHQNDCIHFGIGQRSDARELLLAGRVANLQIDLPLIDFGLDRECVEDGRLVLVDEFAVVKRSDQRGFACEKAGQHVRNF